MKREDHLAWMTCDDCCPSGIPSDGKTGPMFTPYMVKNDIWAKVSRSTNARLCLDCLQKRLGRKLVIEDFQTISFNYPIFFAYQMGLDALR